MHGLLALAIGLSLAGVLLANGLAIAHPDTGDTVWPYVLGGAAAASWAGSAFARPRAHPAIAEGRKPFAARSSRPFFASVASDNTSPGRS